MTIPFEKFFAGYRQYIEIRNHQKLRGLNDLNIFTTLLNKNDEVRLHSRFIGKLLNIHEDHYQGTLFLELFFRHCFPSVMNYRYEDSECYLERDNIDIYLTDGNLHIIIENKIYAGDQKNQIKRYIDTIRNKHPDAGGDQFVVCYLSLDRKSPSTYSLGDVNGYKVEGNKLIQEGFTVGYKSIQYKSQVLPWIKSCYESTKNLTNLAVILGQYQDVILKLYGNYKSNVMDLSDYIKSQQTTGEKKELIRMVFRIEKESSELRTAIINEIFSIVRDKIKEYIEEENISEKWQVTCKFTKLKKPWGFPFNVFLKENKYIGFGLEFRERQYKIIRYGIVRENNDLDLSLLERDLRFSEALAGSDSSLDYAPQQNNWWLRYHDYKVDLVEEAIISSVQQQAKFISEKFIEYIRVYEVDSGMLSRANELFASEMHSITS